MELDELRVGLNNMRAKTDIHGQTECSCGCQEVRVRDGAPTCKGSTVTFKGITDM